MKQRIIRISLLVSFSILFILVNMPLANKSKARIFTLPSLPRPIAEQPAIITSAGQSTDTYIINDISNKLMIQSYFMPQARAADLAEAKTIVFVIGYSPIGLKLQNIKYEEEKARIRELIEEAKDKDMTILAIILGGEKSSDNETKELLGLIFPQSNYLIGLRKSGYNSTIAELARSLEIQLTLVEDVDGISEPFASAFR